MDINTARIAVTVLSLVLFIALVLQTWSRSRKTEYDAAALLPFVGEAGESAALARQGEKK